MNSIVSIETQFFICYLYMQPVAHIDDSLISVMLQNVFKFCVPCKISCSLWMWVLWNGKVYHCAVLRNGSNSRHTDLLLLWYVVLNVSWYSSPSAGLTCKTEEGQSFHISSLLYGGCINTIKDPKPVKWNNGLSRCYAGVSWHYTHSSYISANVEVQSLKHSCWCIA